MNKVEGKRGVKGYNILRIFKRNIENFIDGWNKAIFKVKLITVGYTSIHDII